MTQSPTSSVSFLAASNHTVLVLAATGKTGRRVADQLEAEGVNVRRGSRSSATPFDWHDEATWGSALQGVDSIYVVYAPDLAVPSAPPAITRLCEAAKAAGVRKLVLLSGRGEEEAQRCEGIVQASGLAWTVVRASWFNQNFDEGAFTEMVQQGAIALPVNHVHEPFIDADDIAEVAVAALREAGPSRHDGEVYEVTGPELLTYDAIVAQMAEAAGRPVQLVRITPEQFAAGLTEAGVTGEYADLLNYLMTEVTDGRNEYLADGVQRALGREPKSFKAYAEQAAATGIWAEQTVSQEQAVTL